MNTSWATTVRNQPFSFLVTCWNNADKVHIASWFDHPRDLLHLINVKRKEMPRPIVGIGHSMGGAHLYAFPTQPYHEPIT